jgi:hypothetical protein
MLKRFGVVKRYFSLYRNIALGKNKRLFLFQPVAIAAIMSLRAPSH